MDTIICRTCGCSLVRLGISKEQSGSYHHGGQEHRFCCQGCVDVFVTAPEKYLEETGDLIVCPVCLGEKPRQWAAKLEIGGQEVHFCRCPHCVEAFRKKPDFYVERLEGSISNQGVVDHEGHGVRPA